MQGSHGTGGCQASFGALVDLMNNRKAKCLLYPLFIRLFQHLGNGYDNPGTNIRFPLPYILCNHKKERRLSCQYPGTDFFQPFSVFLHILVNIKEMELYVFGLHCLV